jgi:cytochrome c peroxidase
MPALFFWPLGNRPATSVGTLRGLWQHPPYFHDGSAATPADVVAHYNSARNLKRDAKQRHDLVEYLETP